MAASLATLDNNQHAPVEYERLAWSGDMRKSDVFENLAFQFQSDSLSRDSVESGIFSPNLDFPLLGDKNC
jgi:hypothetical protein